MRDKKVTASTLALTTTPQIKFASVESTSPIHLACHIPCLKQKMRRSILATRSSPRHSIKVGAYHTCNGD